MQSIHKLLFAVLVTLTTTSCEEVIVLDLASETPHTVIEARIDNQTGLYVDLSQSVDFYSTSGYPAITGAQIKITDDAGSSAQLTETTKGRYEAEGWLGQEGHTYQLSIEMDGQIYFASATMPSAVPIDSIYFSFKESTFGPSEQGYVAHLTYQDPVGVDNYYVITVYKNNEYFDRLTLTDRFTDGKPRDRELNEGFSGNRWFNPSDVVEVSLASVDKITYEFYSALNDNQLNTQSGGMIGGAGSTPANPKTNFTGDVLGFFSAQSISRVTIQVPDFPE